MSATHKLKDLKELGITSRFLIDILTKYQNKNYGVEQHNEGHTFDVGYSIYIAICQHCRN